MRAILTQYKLSTNGNGTISVVASSDVKGRVSYDGNATEEQNHVRAAKKIGEGAFPMDAYKLVSGKLPNGDWCHVLVKKGGK